MADQAPASHEVTPGSSAPATEAPFPVSFDERYSAVVGSVSLARTSVAHWVSAQGADELMGSDVVLAVSEACTNAVVHGHDQGGEGSFRVHVQGYGDLMRVTVSDDGRGMAPRPDSPGLGFGLPLMAALTDSLQFQPAAGHRGTVVSMVFTVAGARARTRSAR